MTETEEELGALRQQASKLVRLAKNVEEIATGGTVVEAGSAEEYATGSWRLYRPVLHENRCVHCLFCWLYCPDGAIVIKGGRVVGIDYAHCKGCAICEVVCPDKARAIEMVRER
jgi:2-oxoacid:acceptor oxidoreductase delta subunit (pyruvate/2-ketoisovalerate family)